VPPPLLLLLLLLPPPPSSLLGVPVAVCSTSNERAVSTIVRVMLGDKVASIMRVFAGDVVPKKKPDPAIYLLAAKELGVNPARCGRVKLHMSYNK
jgi:beta-phosphoglucomutase-like phosphatase (HAD superfamily)